MLDAVSIASGLKACFAVILVPNGAPSNGHPTILSGYSDRAVAEYVIHALGDEAPALPAWCDKMDGSPVNMLCGNNVYAPIWSKKIIVPAPLKDCAP